MRKHRSYPVEFKRQVAQGWRVKGRRKRAAPTRKRTRAWWVSTTAAASGGGVAAPVPTGPTPPSEDAEQAPALSLNHGWTPC